MNVTELAPGLWRWTAPHPEWTAEQGGAEGWERDVGSVYCEAFGDVLLIDPVLPPEGEELDRFWRALDRDVARAASPLHILLTCGWHVRSSVDIQARYAGATFWAPGSGGQLAGRARAIEAALADEVLLWLPSHQALVAGDTLLGGGDGRIRLCPVSWLGDRDPAAVRAALRDRIGDLTVERVLVSHGDPVVTGARAALDRALAC